MVVTWWIVDFLRSAEQQDALLLLMEKVVEHNRLTGEH